jgi:HSP20 family molecular chaperone IbpA
MADQASKYFLLYNSNDYCREKQSQSLQDEPNAHEIVQNNDEFCLSIDVPGVKSSDLVVSVDGRVLYITGACRVTTPGGQTLKKARFSKSFVIDPQTVDLTQLKANLADGVLVMTAPRMVKPEPRVVKVTTDPHPDPIVGDEPTNNKSDEALETLAKGVATSEVKELEKEGSQKE